MTLRDYLRLLQRRAAVVVVTLLAALAAALAVAFQLPQTYTATATVRTPVASDLVSGAVRSDAVSYLPLLQNTYAKLATSQGVRAELAQRLGVRRAPSVAVSGVANTELLDVRATSSSRELAARAANGLATLLIERARGLAAQYGTAADASFKSRTAALNAAILRDRLAIGRLRATSTPGDQAAAAKLAQLETDIHIRAGALASLLSTQEAAAVAAAAQASDVSVVAPALPPANGSRPSPVLIGAIGGIVGLIAGLAMAFVAEGLSERVRTRSQIQAASRAAVIGEVYAPRRGHTLAGTNGGAPLAEPYRRIAASLFPVHGGRRLRTVLVTSARPREGKSTVAANLAVALGEAGRSVVLVDANLQAPTLHEIFPVSNELGLRSALAGDHDINEVVQLDIASGVSVVPAGSDEAAGHGRFGSVGLTRALARLGEDFEVVIVDAPAVLARAEPLTLGPMVDGVVLVVAEGRVDRNDVETTTEQLHGVGANLLGVVVNHRRKTVPYNSTGGRATRAGHDA